MVVIEDSANWTSEGMTPKQPKQRENKQSKGKNKKVIEQGNCNVGRGNVL